jgi:signal transduction histidine kinase
MGKKEINYLDILDALKMLVEKAEGKEKKELRAKQKEFIKQVKKIIALDIEKDNEKYATAIESLEKTNKDIESAIKDVNKISHVLTSITNTMNVIGEFV